MVFRRVVDLNRRSFFNTLRLSDSAWGNWRSARVLSNLLYPWRRCCYRARRFWACNADAHHLLSDALKINAGSRQNRSNSRRWYSSAMPEPIINSRCWSILATLKSPAIPPRKLSNGDKHMRQEFKASKGIAFFIWKMNPKTRAVWITDKDFNPQLPNILCLIAIAK